jgi:hypothetical protein
MRRSEGRDRACSAAIRICPLRHQRRKRSGSEKEYGEQIPVVFVNGNKAFKYHVGEAELEEKVKRLWKT